MAVKKGVDLLKDLFDVSGKVALITGATGGFGHTAAMALAMAGVKVMATGRSEDTLKALAEEIREQGGKAGYSAGSPIEHDDVKGVVKDTVDQFGGIDIRSCSMPLSTVCDTMPQRRLWTSSLCLPDPLWYTHRPCYPNQSFLRFCLLASGERLKNM